MMCRRDRLECAPAQSGIPMSNSHAQPPASSTAQLDWDAHGQPLSRQFGDVYFSNENGLAETRYVFLDNNELPARFAALTDGEHLSIGETGFGSGLNFLCAWQLFERVAPAGARLHFVSVEKYPFSRADLQRALALWPELAPYAQALLQQYVALHPGFQRLSFAEGRVVLTLLVGDALELLPQLDARIDAWFLDGFAPAKNPDMWAPDLFAELTRLSAPAATFGTFSSAGLVRRGLKEAGFSVKRVPGLGKKWEVLKGQFLGEPNSRSSPWFARPPVLSGERHALVIGAGLAGAARRRAAAQRPCFRGLARRSGLSVSRRAARAAGCRSLQVSRRRQRRWRSPVHAGHLRHRLDQARPRRPHRPHQG